MRKIIIILSSLIMLGSCKKFVELSPLDQASVTNSFNTPADINLAVMGVYDGLQRATYADDMAAFNELVSDNASVQPSRLGDAGKGDYRELELFLFTDKNAIIQNRWSALYTAIGRANLVLSKVEQVPFTDVNLKKQFIGEAKFLRALFYFDLVRFFGPVPLSLSEIVKAEEAFAIPRSPEPEVYNAIIADLTEAIATLPLSYASGLVGRATSGAAKGLLAKVYLTNKNPAAALTLLRELTKAPYTYRLALTYAAAFDTDNTIESLFEVQYSATVPGEGCSYPNLFLTTDNTIGKDVFGPTYLGNTAQGVCLPTDELVNAFDVNDQRRSYTFLRYFSRTEALNLYICYKYRGVPTSPNNSEDNIYVLRYADILLMLAEAINESGNGPTPEAYDAVDDVRRRAGLPVITRTLNYESFKTTLLNERRFEFAFENQRWFDLKRFGKAIEVLGAKGYAIQSKHLLFPIPRKEVEISQGTVTQNPGY